MADRFPLIFNTSVGQIQELSASDNLDMTSSSISNLSSLTVSGTVAAGDFNSTSDVNLQINGVSFDWTDTHQPSAGVIAQDVEKVLPEIIRDNPTGYKSLNYNGLIGLLIEAVKEQQEQINTLKKEIEDLSK
jgi:hypothetical protein